MSVLVTFVTHHTNSMRHTVMWPVRLYHKFLHYLKHCAIFGKKIRNINFFPHTICLLWTSRSPLPVVTEVQPTSEAETPMRRSYVVSMRWMMIYEYEVPGRVLNLWSTKLPRLWSPWESSPSRKNPHDRTRNWTRDVIISSQKLWPLDHEAGHGT
jgi:hypothetical protein